MFIIFVYSATTLSGPGPPHYRGFTITQNTPHSLGLLWTSDQERLTDNTQQTQQTNVHAPGGIRNYIPNKRAATDPCLRPRGHCDRHTIHNNLLIFLD
jgi:hypothetical protein